MPRVARLRPPPAAAPYINKRDASRQASDRTALPKSAAIANTAASSTTATSAAVDALRLPADAAGNSNSAKTKSSGATRRAARGADSHQPERHSRDEQRDFGEAELAAMGRKDLQQIAKRFDGVKGNWPSREIIQGILTAQRQQKQEEPTTTKPPAQPILRPFLASNDGDGDVVMKDADDVLLLESAGADQTPALLEPATDATTPLTSPPPPSPPPPPIPPTAHRFFCRIGGGVFDAVAPGGVGAYDGLEVFLRNLSAAVGSGVLYPLRAPIVPRDRVPSGMDNATVCGICFMWNATGASEDTRPACQSETAANSSLERATAKPSGDHLAGFVLNQERNKTEGFRQSEWDSTTAADADADAVFVDNAAVATTTSSGSSNDEPNVAGPSMFVILTSFCSPWRELGAFTT
ncbi:hypothetical protein DFJ73DRAFT_842859, partial [Zopfochytrium polystomum]